MKGKSKFDESRNYEDDFMHDSSFEDFMFLTDKEVLYFEVDND